MLKSAYVKNVSEEQVYLNGTESSKKGGESLEDDERERPAFNLQNKRVDGNYSKVFRRRLNFEC
jgi:hypothetical protein